MQELAYRSFSASTTTPFALSQVENAKLEFADGRTPEQPAGPGGRRGGNDRGGMEEQYSSFGGRGGGGGMGGGDARPGDWSCPGCHANVFASKNSCFKVRRPENENHR
jgi:hypothetical protein